MQAKKIVSFFRKYFITGMIVIIPVWVTFVVLKAVATWINDVFILLPPTLQPKTYIPLFGIEIIVILLLILLIGLITSNYVGRKFLQWGELVLAKIPVIKTVYQGVKHLTTGIMSDKKIFSRVVLLEFPIKGLNFIGFVTGEAPNFISDQNQGKVLKIFIPTTPNPTSGFFCLAAEDQVKPLDISVDDAFKVIISAGYANLDLT
ncbi:DUF502 domain-containing protein [Acidobacteriota bacterium]